MSEPIAARLPESAAQVVKEDHRHICAGLRQDLEHLEGSELLVTGGAGFLGYSLVQSLCYWNRQVQPADAVRVVVMDHFRFGVPGWLERLARRKEVRVLSADITEPLPGNLGEPDYIMHAASIASPTFYRRYPIETMDANVNGLRSLLEYCRSRQDKGRPVHGILFFSSSEIYGDPPDGFIPTPETYRGNVSCTGPRACYDESKRFGETLCVNFADQHEVAVKAVRPFNNYGPGLRITDRRVVPDFARDVLANRDITLLSDGSPTRTFCYVSDAVVGYYRALVRGRRGEAYNIGVDHPEISIRELAETTAQVARELFGYRGGVVHDQSLDDQYLVDNPNRRCPSIEKARAELDFSPVVSLEEGLRRSLVWYREHQE